MPGDYTQQFNDALRRGDDAFALALLERGRVTIHSVYPSHVGGVLRSMSIIFPAIEHVREQVAQALVRRGADIDAVVAYSDGNTSVTPAGHAIHMGEPSSLALCHRLGANMSLVRPRTSRVENSHGAKELAIRAQQPECLAYLLDNVYMARPVKLSRQEMQDLCTSPLCGDRSIALYKVLQNRDFDFSRLVEAKVDPKAPGGMCFSDVLLATAQKSGDAAFIRYIVRDLGLASTAPRLDNSKGFVNRKLPITELLAITQPEVALVKYECMACDALGATKVCTGCRVARYCSKDCSRMHWKTGGHKEDCKEMQRHKAAIASLESPEASAPSQL